MMNEEQRHLLITNTKAFGDDLRAEDIFSYLQSKFILDFDEVEIIKSEKTSRRKVEYLLKILATKGASGFFQFYNALVNAEYFHLAELLQSGLGDATDSAGFQPSQDHPNAEAILREGGVPQRPQKFTPRPEVLQKLQSALYQLKNTIGWVVFHGMVGSGKTVLAAEALRNAKLLDECFPGGIFWLAVGNVDNYKLLMKMQNLCTWLDKSETKQVPRNLEDARNILRSLMLHSYPRSLLVLDDLWSPDMARYFDIQARILVTTRYTAVSDHIGGLVLKVTIPDGLSVDESISLLSSYLDMPPDCLPPEANGIVKECNGSPLALALIGASLKSRPNRWGYYLNQMKGGRVSKLKSKFGYEYPTLFEAIETSITQLPAELREKYQYFSLFEEDTKVSAKVFSTLWNEEVIDVEDSMDELVAHSLVKRQPISIDSPYEAYCIHDLLLDYLKESMADPDHQPTLQQLHVDLVQKYSKLCEGNWTRLTNDGYIYWHLISHMLQGGLLSEAVDLMLNFDWMEAEVMVTSVANLINDYTHLIKYVSDELSKTLTDFRNFIGVHANLLAKTVTVHHILQLALSNPGSGVVYSRAKKLVLEKIKTESAVYLDWCNLQIDCLTSNLSGLRLSVQHHTSAVFTCNVCMFQKQEIVVSSGGDSIIKVWKLESGEEMWSLQGHVDTVYCCRFSPNGDRIVSCSADKSIKIWSNEYGAMIVNMMGHQGDVYCCDFSPSGDHVVSCSMDKTIRIWDSTTGFLLMPLMGHLDAVNWCAYSPDGTRIASASNDSTVKVWNSKTGEILFSCGEEDDFYSFCSFTPTGDRIIAATQNYLQFFDSDSGALSNHIITASEVICVAHSRDGVLAASGHADTIAQLWDINKEVCLGTFEGHSGFIRGICFNADASKIVTASEDGTCKVWSIVQGNLKTVKLRKVFDVDFSQPDHVVIVAVDNANKIKRMQDNQDTVIEETGPLPSKITICVFSSDKSNICVGCTDGNIQIFDAVTLMLLRKMPSHKASVSHVCFGKSSILMTAADDGNVKVWNYVTKEHLHDLSEHTSLVTKTTIFHEDAMGLTSSFDGSLKVWDLKSGTCIFTCWHKQDESLLCCDVSRDNRFIVSGSAGGTAKLWDGAGGNELHLLLGHNDCVRSVAFSPNSKTLLTGADDGIIKLWEVASGTCLNTFVKHRIWVTDLHFSENGDRFVSISDDIKIWSTRILLQTFKIRGNFLKRVMVSQDFRTFVTIDDRGELYILKQL